MLDEISGQTMKMQIYMDAIENLLSTYVMLPPELLVEIENFIDTNKQLGYTTCHELVREAIRFKRGALKGQGEYVDSKEDYEKSK